jgi:glycosyltransferase involved in cell wall biosynthesis
MIHELIHMFDKQFTWVWAPFVKFINTRIIIGKIFKTKFADCYKQNKIPLEYLARFQIIYNCLEYFPDSIPEKEFKKPLKIYYAGRGGPQKRVWIIVDIIRKCRELHLPVEFKLAGSFKNELPQDLIDDGTFVGEIQGGEAMYNFHKSNDILLMTSAWEGFPIVIMEAMAFGAIPLVANVDAIPEHITDAINGFLINEVVDEAKMVDEAIEKIKYLSKNSNTHIQISLNAYHYAGTHFSEEAFRDEYRKLLCA